MSQVSQVIETHLRTLLTEDDKQVPEMSPELVLLDSGLDSLGFAVLVTRLEDELGYDPFSLMEEAFYPRTLAELTSVYEQYAPGR